MAAAVGEGWIRAGHRLSIGGRSDRKAGLLADRLGPASRSVTPEVVARETDAVLLAVAWEGVEEMLRLAGAPQQSLEGKTLIDCTNAVDYRTFALKPSNGSAAGTIAELAPGAHIVKALHLFAGQSWLSPPPASELVARLVNALTLPAWWSVCQARDGRCAPACARAPLHRASDWLVRTEAAWKGRLERLRSVEYEKGLDKGSCLVGPRA